MIRYLLITINDENERPAEKDDIIEALEKIPGVTVQKIEEGV